jgi:hypothetical protein
VLSLSKDMSRDADSTVRTQGVTVTPKALDEEVVTRTAVCCSWSPAQLMHEQECL